MENVNEKIQKVKEVLTGIVKRSYHFTAPDKPKAPYAVWHEEGQNVMYADNKAVEHAESGVIQYFTKEEYSAVSDEIFEAFTNADICIRLNSIQYEEDTGLIHYEWEWEL